MMAEIVGVSPGPAVKWTKLNGATGPATPLVDEVSDDGCWRATFAGVRCMCPVR